MKKLFALFIILFVVGCPNIYRASANPTQTPNQQAKQAVNNHIELITVPELKKKMDEHESLLIVDVSEHTGLVIRDALNIPFSKLEDSLAQLPKDKLIVTVCGCPHEATSGAAVQMLQSWGYTKVVALKGGQLAWDEARYPVDMIIANGERVHDDRKDSKPQQGNGEVMIPIQRSPDFKPNDSKPRPTLEQRKRTRQQAPPATDENNENNKTAPSQK